MKHPAFYLAALALGTFCYTWWKTIPIACTIWGWFVIISLTLVKWTRYFEGKVHQESHSDVKISNKKQRHCIRFQGLPWQNTISWWSKMTVYCLSSGSCKSEIKVSALSEISQGILTGLFLASGVCVSHSVMSDSLQPHGL